MTGFSTDSVPVSELGKSARDQSLDEEPPMVKKQKQESLLCVSDGFSIYCLDLDRIGKDCFDYPETLPVVSTINLRKENYPITGALFQLGPLGLMIGGKVDIKHSSSGSSKEIHQLFLANGTLRLSFYRGIPFLPPENPKSWRKGIPPLKNPRIWPRVEKIDNHLHVIESIPLCAELRPCHDWIPSHEVLDLDDVDRGWTEVLPMGVKRSGKYDPMADELVLGDRMFAVRNQCGPLFYSLDCKSNKISWKFDHRTYKDCFHVTQLLNMGSCICVGWFDKPVPGYVVIGFIYDNKVEGDNLDYQYTVASAMAFLAKPSGDIICHQSLPEFFDGVGTIYCPGSTVFRKDIDTSSRSTFCVVLMGDAYDVAIAENILYISTFCVEEEANLDCLSVSSGIAEERQFLKIRFLKKQVYKVGQILRNRGDTSLDDLEPPPRCPPALRLSACFI